ncbi:MAG: LytR/AlgR family response regulator transcription factor [Lachnospiraceae bacterium]
MDNIREFLWECKGGMLKLKGRDICYIHTAQRKTYIHTSMRVYQIRSTLKEEEQRLKDLPVIRVHHGYLVHLGGMESLIKNEVIMRNGDKIPVSERRKKYVLEQVKAYVNKEGKYKKIR